MRWLDAQIGDGRIRLRDSDIRTLCGAIASGIGRGILPCFVGDTHPELRRSMPRDPVLSRDLWLLIHPDARESARVSPRRVAGRALHGGCGPLRRFRSCHPAHLVLSCGA